MKEGPGPRQKWGTAGRLREGEGWQRRGGARAGGRTEMKVGQKVTAELNEEAPMS